MTSFVESASARRRIGGFAPILPFVALVVLFFLPRLLGGSSIVYSTCVLIAIFSVMAYGADTILSYLGEVSLGHTIFWATGGYAAAMLSTVYGWNGWETAAAAVVVAVMLAVLLGLATLRTREFVFSLVTYAAAIVAFEIVFNWPLLGGSDGFVGIPMLVLPSPFGTFNGGSSEELWPVAFALLALAVLFIHRFRRSRLGRQALMAQMNADLARSLGVNIRRVRLFVFILSAIPSALAGWLYAYQRAYVGPDMFESYFLVLMLTAIILPGRRILFGPILGTAIVIVQQTFFSIGGDGDKIILGAVLAVVLILWPSGLMGAVRTLTRRKAA
jgi:branched-chain amino acid transport system permease protein